MLLLPNDKPQGRGASPRPAGGAGSVSYAFFNDSIHDVAKAFCSSGVTGSMSGPVEKMSTISWGLEPNFNL